MYKIENICKSFTEKKQNTDVLKNISLHFEKKGLYFIVGKSGCGKTTLLSILGGLLSPTSGTITYNKKTIISTDFRQNIVSYVFQDFNLINDFSLEDNIRVVGNSNLSFINDLLFLLGLNDKRKTKVKYLSGGEKQRLAIGRAIAKRAEIILLDEPTGNLDSKNSKLIFQLLKKISFNKLVIVVSHDKESASLYADHIINMSDGHIESIESVNHYSNVEFSCTSELNDNILRIYDKLQDNKYTKLNFEYNGTVEEISISKYDYLSTLQKKLKKLDNNTLVKLSIKNNNQQTLTIDFNNQQTNVFNSSFQFKYALNLLFKSKLKFFISVLMISLSLILSFLGTNIISFDEKKALLKGTEEYNYLSYSIEEKTYNIPTEEDILNYKGEILYEELSNNCTTIPVFCIDKMVNESKLINKSLLQVIDNNTLFDVFNCDKLDKNEIIVSDLFIKYYFPKKGIGDIIEIKIKAFNEPLICRIRKIVSTNYANEKILEKIYDEDYLYKNEDYLLNKYFSIFTTIDIYEEFAKNNSLYIKSANIFIDENNYNMYVNSNLEILYSKNESSNILYGRKPSSKNEIMINEYIFNRYYDSVDDILDKELAYKDLNKSINYIKYRNVLNFYEITEKVKVVGICDSTTNIIIDEGFFTELCKKSLYYFCDYFALHNPNNDTINYMNDNNISFTSEVLLPAYVIDKGLKSSINIIIVIINIIFLTITASLLYFFCHLSIKSKMKEIAILKSLGIKIKKITFVFLYHNLLLIIISLLISSLLSITFLKLINNILMKEDVFNIMYPLFSFEYISIFTIILSILIIGTISTLLPIKNIRRVDIQEILKSF